MGMKCISLLTIFLLQLNYYFAQYPAELRNSELREWLKLNQYDGYFNDLGYNSGREQMYSYTDEVNGKIYCIYTDFEMDAELTTYPNPINAEHIVPQSFYGGVSPMRSDIHNYRPSHQNVNSARSNYDFGEVNDNQATWHGINGQGDYVSQSNEPNPNNNYSEGINGLFEPQEDRKGDVARQVFYFYTMYPTQAGEINELVDVDLMFQWHQNDPADLLEVQRNNRIEEVQGNRNPYVDYPGLVYDAWLWQEILGCTDPNASNYIQEANTDDGSCLYDQMGCTDPFYLEYDPFVTVDDGSCTTLKVLGCIYANASNYNPEANTNESGSCIFPDLCSGDFNEDGFITASDLSLFLGSFGEECP